MYRLLLPLLVLLQCATPATPVADAPAGQPNVIFILADDLGIMDINAYATHYVGTPADSMFYETPHLNRLIARSVAFSQGYATQLCSPSRAGILAGRFAPRLGFMTAMPLRETYYNQNLPVPEGYYQHDVLDHHDDIAIERAWDNSTSNSALPPEVVTLPEAMPQYTSAFLGKWHVGGFGAAGVQPYDQGFRDLAYFDGGGSAYYGWRPGWNNKSMARYPEMPQAEWEIGNAGPATGEDYLTDDLTARALGFLDERSATPGEPFFLYFNHFAVHSPYQGVEGEVEHYRDKATRGWNGHRDPVYASMIQGLDRSVGQLMAKLRETGLADNTVVVFMSDNGGIDHKLTPHDDGTDNSPFLGGKACVTEGGIRVPLFVHLPGQVTGRWEETPVDYADLYPTLLEATGYDAVAAVREQDLDGRSFWSLVNEKSSSEYTKDTRYWHYPFNVIYRSPYDGLALTPHSAIRSGDDKLIFDWYGRLHLYDIAADPYERNDLAAAEPERRDRLFRELMTWLEENVDRRYWPTVNAEYLPADEPREVAFRNLVGR